MFYEAKTGASGLAIDPFKALIGPRPIGWISTVSAAGARNLAPFSFFNAVAEDPFYLAIGIGERSAGGKKDTLRNIEETGEFVHNLATHDLREAMNASSAGAAYAVDEFTLAKVTAAACRLVAAPRVLESLAAFECKLHGIMPLPGDGGHAADHLVVGRVVGVHLDERVIVNGRVGGAALKLIGRLGYSEYTTADAPWRMRRPD